MKIKELKIISFRHAVIESRFNELFHKLLLRKELNTSDLTYLLKVAIIFINFGDDNLKKLAYKIIVNYSKQYADYKALYDVSINLNYIPISKVIELNIFNEDEREKHFFGLYLSAYQENYKYNNYYITEGQKQLFNFAKKNIDFVLVAPTSYGKSEIIIEKVYSNLERKICIIVPSKALLAQTKKRLLEKSNGNLHRVITHPEMYKSTENHFVSVLTQERLLRLLEKNPDLSFDLILIDEAHNLFDDDNRATLLAQTLMIIKNRNNKTIFNFFSPFIADGSNLEIKKIDYKLEYKKTSEFIKIEKFYLCDITSNKKLFIYDQFSDIFIETNKVYQDEKELIQNEKANKNIIYFNRPIHIEQFTKELIDTLPDISSDIDEIIENISDFVHPDYDLIKSIKKGILYHHGGMPEIIRLYVEDLFSNNQNFSFIITSSTLLEGVNIPAEKIFLFSLKKGTSKLAKSQFKNLIGRINRFSEIFNPQSANLALLEPEIYIVKSKYLDSRIKPDKFLSEHAKIDIKIKDNVENVLLKDENELKEEEKQKLEDKLEFLENIEPGVTNIQDVQYAQSEIGRLCYKYNVYDFDIKQNENRLIENLVQYNNTNNTLIYNANDLLDSIYSIFLRNITVINKNIERLQNEPARRFYSMIVVWRSSSASYKEMIYSLTRYWKNLPASEKFIYMGEKWGEQKRNPTDHKPLYVNIAGLSYSSITNLAILKIKEEQDFVEYNLLKYVEILKDLSLIENNFYDKVKYGTSDKKMIIMLKNGFSLELTKCISKPPYSNFLSIDEEMDEVIVSKEIIDEMLKNNENKILIFEAKYHITN